jgi:hypothetical protein
MDLRNAIYCIEMMKKYQTYSGQRIGIVQVPEGELEHLVQSGELQLPNKTIILFREEFAPEIVDPTKVLPTGFYLLETPFQKEVISERSARGQLQFSSPSQKIKRDYIEEIKVFY